MLLLPLGVLGGKGGYLSQEQHHGDRQYGLVVKLLWPRCTLGPDTE